MTNKSSRCLVYGDPRTWNMDLHLLSAVLFALAVHGSMGCKEPWELNTKTLSNGSVIGFKNVTTIGKQESLLWSWPGEKQELWELSMLRSYEEERTEGKITYRRAHHDEKTVVTISWAINGKDTSSTSNKKRIYSKPWTLWVCNGLNIEFRSDKTGSWEFEIGDFLLQRSPEGMQTERDNYHSRSKRAEDFEETEYPQANTNDTQPRNPMDCIYDYFFAEEDPARGRSGGIFTRVRNWMKDVGCRFGLGCGDYPKGYIPPMATLPPLDPDAETITEVSNSENNVW